MLEAGSLRHSTPKRCAFEPVPLLQLLPLRSGVFECHLRRSSHIIPEKHVGWRPLVMSAFPLCISKFQEFVYNVSLRTTMQLSSAGVGQNLRGV
ncbi:hypothetical protein BDL97_12G000500 [Sphagnum fallax]|nr:hypothetical protein BDL97_12G000500 [Sphagnum fallax]